MATNQTVTELTNFIKDQFKQSKVTPRHQSRSKLFPDVDPVTIRAASHSNPPFQQHSLKQSKEQTTTRPDSVPFMQMGFWDSNSHPEYVPSMPPNSMSIPQHILPYGQQVMVKDNGYTTECWIRQCYKMPQGEKTQIRGTKVWWRHKQIYL